MFQNPFSRFFNRHASSPRERIGNEALDQMVNDYYVNRHRIAWLSELDLQRNPSLQAIVNTDMRIFQTSLTSRVPDEDPRFVLGSPNPIYRTEPETAIYRLFHNGVFCDLHLLVGRRFLFRDDEQLSEFVRSITERISSILYDTHNEQMDTEEDHVKLYVELMLHRFSDRQHLPLDRLRLVGIKLVEECMQYISSQYIEDDLSFDEMCEENPTLETNISLYKDYMERDDAPDLFYDVCFFIETESTRTLIPFFHQRKDISYDDSVLLNVIEDFVDNLPNKLFYPCIDDKGRLSNVFLYTKHIVRIQPMMTIDALKLVNNHRLPQMVLSSGL